MATTAHRRTSVALVAAVMLGRLGSATAAEASCAAASGAQHLDAADLVFEGRALEGAQAADGTLLSPARFAVADRIKGESPDVVEVATGTRDQGDGLVMMLSEGIGPRPGDIWRIYATHGGSGAPLNTSSCSGSVRLAATGNAAEEAGAATRGSPDHDYQLVADQVPGFGGAWIEGGAGVGRAGGTLHLWLTDPTQDAAARAQALLVERLGPDFAQDDVAVHEADFTWAQLQEWFAAATDVHTLPGVVFTDADEQTNRLVVGVQHPRRHERRIRDWLEERSIPQQAVTITETEPVGYDSGTQPWSEGGFTGPMLLALAGLAAVAGTVGQRRRATTTGAG